VEERAAVHLAAGREREGVQRDEGRGHERIGQSRARQAPQLVRRRRGTVARQHERHQAPLALRVLRRQDDHVAHLWVPRQRRLDLPRLDPHAAHLHLVVGAAGELERAVGALAREVAGAVHAAAALGAVRVGQEALRGEVRPVQVAAREGDAADVELAGHARRHGLELAVEDVQPRAVDRPADRGQDGPPPGEPSSRNALTTWLSVGPYWFTRRQDGRRARRPAIWGVMRSASPALTISRNSGKPACVSAAAASCCSATHGKNRRSTERAARKRRSSDGSRRTSSDTSTSRPPEHRVAKISWNDTSKLGEANCSVARRAGRLAELPRDQVAERTLRHRHALRAPVEPEVKMT
jgi:hypothetical protein